MKNSFENVISEVMNKITHNEDIFNLSVAGLSEMDREVIIDTLRDEGYVTQTKGNKLWVKRSNGLRQSIKKLINTKGLS